MADKNVLLQNDTGDNLLPKTNLENVDGLADIKNKVINITNQDTNGWLDLPIDISFIKTNTKLKYKIKSRILFITGWITPKETFDILYEHIPISNLIFETDNPDDKTSDKAPGTATEDFQGQDFQPVNGGNQPLTIGIYEGKLCFGWFQHITTQYYRIHITLPLK